MINNNNNDVISNNDFVDIVDIVDSGNLYNSYIYVSMIKYSNNIIELEWSEKNQCYVVQKF